MDVKQLRYFVAIAQQGSLSAAARRLHVVQPALSQALAALETELGTPLFTRGPTGVVPTTSGTELLHHALAILRQIDRAKAAIQSTLDTASGPVRIGILHSAAPVACAPLFTRLRQEAPGIQPQLVVGYSDALAQRLRRGELDLAMLVLASDERGESDAHLYEENICLVTPASHAGGTPPLELPSLQDFPLLLSMAQPLHQSLLALAQARKLRLNIMGGVEDISSLLLLCEAGQFSTLLPEGLAGTLTRGTSLVVRRIAHPAFSRRVVVRACPDLPKSHAVIAAERIMKATLASQA
ncbi:LysR family transcriptional regulator [Pigmentiphaga sp. H8]|uniref:LysR family transcriptional regulator n=1 Tax=unclassified Pigmentiphaga TaxID=2626614 RepID=UPI000F5ACD57|nr:LysR family transcriptional regulator [Pigmentiphaga sp. H8]AZG09509.1 LysR family transcriptional regulator [Pigmentiphaga sp. H8]